jgi:predicted pyridoxine 5'-phosphate oxidase superfamily flavin-nucleotide-binding protein
MSVPGDAVTSRPLTLDALERCFEGSIPAVLATCSAEGEPNVSYLSRARRVDDQRVALSNQFMSKTARNLAENPYACLLLMDVVTHDEFRLHLVYERSERHGRVFDNLRHDVEVLAALSGMQGVFRLKAADVFRVVHIEQVPPHPEHLEPLTTGTMRAPSLAAISQVCARVSRCADLDALVEAVVDGVQRTLGFGHVALMLLDETGQFLYTIASRGFPEESLGSEIALGVGVVGTAAAQCVPIRVGNLKHASKYAHTVRRTFEEQGGEARRDLPPPGLPGADSRMAIPAMALGRLVGVLQVDDPRPVAYDEGCESALAVVAALVGTAIETIRAEERIDALEPPATVGPVTDPGRPAVTATVRFSAVDGSVFVDGIYLIKGVAGRLLWLLLNAHAKGQREFSNKALRAEPSLELPGYRDNFESRLILLKRRLGERGAPMHIEATGRGRFRFEVSAVVRLERLPT